MSKLVYRGVAHRSEEKPQLTRKHGENLRYRGAEYRGDDADKLAEKNGGGAQLVYRGVNRSK